MLIAEIPPKRQALVVALLALLLLVWWLSTPRFGGLPDFEAVEDVSQMKQAFAGYLQPIVAYHNTRISAQREELKQLQQTRDASGELGFWQRWQLKSIAADYEVDWLPEDPGSVLAELLLRVDVIPEPLALAQAAKESGWGRSRFAREGNNLFGLWCYQRGCGIVPKNREAGAAHEVAEFDSVSDAVAYYLHNLNTHPSYQDLRERRQTMRHHNAKLDPQALANGLLMYSQRRGAYVEEIQSMVRQFLEIQEAGAS